MSEVQVPAPRWQPERPRLRPVRLLVAWVVFALVLLLSAWIVPGAEIDSFQGALATAAVVAALNAIVPPLIAALRLPLTLVVDFVLVLIADALILKAASDLELGLLLDGLWTALVLALVMAAVGTVVQVVVGANDADPRAFAVASRVARRQGLIDRTDVPGIVFLEIDGLSMPVLQSAMRGGSAPGMAAWIASGSHLLAEWETDLSSQTGASQAGILLGSNDDIPAFRWVEKETGLLMTCSAPGDCAEIEARRTCGLGLLRDGGASRGNLLSGEADEAILTVSRMAAEKRANPGYRSFFANGGNVTRTLVLFFAEVGIELVAAARQRRRDVRPRGHRGGTYPFLRAAMCVAVRELVADAVITDMLRGRPAVYATFAAYDEVAHHSGTERADTLETLRKLDQVFMQIDAARRYAPRPYEIVVLSDHGQTQGATFLQRNGYTLRDLVHDNLEARGAADLGAGDENDTLVGQAVKEATGRSQEGGGGRKTVDGEQAVVLGSGNLGLVYLMEERRRLTREEIETRHPRLIPALRAHPHVGFLLVRSEDGPVVLGAEGEHRLADGRVVGIDPLAGFSPRAAGHLARTDGFPHVADIMVNSFYDPVLEEGCAFEELISFHGGMGGAQTRPFILYPSSLPGPDGTPVGAPAVNALLRSWRAHLQGGPTR